jgi:hypothetical protein
VKTISKGYRVERWAQTPNNLNDWLEWKLWGGAEYAGGYHETCLDAMLYATKQAADRNAEAWRKDGYRVEVIRIG